VVAQQNRDGSSGKCAITDCATQQFEADIAACFSPFLESIKCREAKELRAFFGGPFNNHQNQLCGLLRPSMNSFGLDHFS
jgi:hypothetical protein